MASHFSNTGVPEGTTEYSYNANGDIEKEIRKSPAGKMESTTVWTYNDEGNVRIKSMTDANGEPMRKTFFRYNTEGNCTQEICFYKDGSTYSEFHYQHDPYGNLISKKVVKAPAEAPGEEYESIDRYGMPVEGSLKRKSELLPTNVSIVTNTAAVERLFPERNQSAVSRQ